MNVEGWFMGGNIEPERIRPIAPTVGEGEKFSTHFLSRSCHDKMPAAPETFRDTERGRLAPKQVSFARSLVSVKSVPPVPTEVKVEEFHGLQEGQSGPEVERVQQVLNKWNSKLGVSVSGEYDQSTREALTLYKAIYGGVGSGASVDELTARHLRGMEDGTFWNNPPQKTANQEMLYHASRELGKPYVLGGDGVHSTDCGKLTSQAYSQSGLGQVSRLADMQYHAARKGMKGLALHQSDPEAGDLVFFRVPTSQSGMAYDGVTHVTMYVGDGMTLAASSAAGKVVLQPLSQLKQYVAGFGRVKEQFIASRG